ncbi:MAG TPA: endolytic transglycosylase MltG [Candidatus Limnocylindria bacterium]|nr:endolytic transglycosylase MltG [Candidatus Limnocylindria bacterium]
MTRPPDPRWDLEERRNARIRAMRKDREAPVRRRRTFQPVVLLGWFAGVIALLGVLIFLGFLAFAPRLMAWVEEHPGSIEHGIVRDFVEWYEPGALADEPAGEDGARITITVPSGASSADIGQLLFDEGVIESRLAFQFAVLQAGREETLQAGTYDLSPSLRPSEIVAALRLESGPEVAITLQEGWRLEEVVGYLGTTKLTMNLGEFRRLVEDPPADVIRDYDFLADLRRGRTLEGYLYPDTYRLFVNASAREVLDRLLTGFADHFTNRIRNGIRARGLTIDEAVALASIVEREAVLDKERPLIAGVYLNRINNPNAETVGLLNADPTLQYGLGTAEFGDAPLSEWGLIEWWPQLQVSGGEVQLPEELAGYQTYLNKGLPPTPIASPRGASLAAVARADTGSGYFYFVAACPGGQRDGSHYFARTLGEQEQNIARANAECQ